MSAVPRSDTPPVGEPKPLRPTPLSVPADGRLSPRHWSLKWKFVGLISAVVLLIAGAQNLIFYRLDSNVFTENLRAEVSVLAEVVADNSASALLFASTEDAAEVLSSLAHAPSIRQAYLFNADGNVLAEYVAPGQSSTPPDAIGDKPGQLITADRLIVRQPVFLNEELIGALHISADFRDLQARQRVRVVLWSAVLFGALALAFLMAIWSQRFFVKPMLDLARLSARVEAEQDYSLRAERTSSDEVGMLVDSFNGMLDAINERDEAIAAQTHALRQTNPELERARANLELRVRERTSELQASEKRFKALLESAPDAILISREDGTIDLVNAQAERLFGYSGPDLLGKPLEILLPEAVRERHVANRQAYVKAPEAREMGTDLPLMAIRKDGTTFPVNISLSPIHTDQGMHVAASVRDVTSRNERERKLLEAMEDLGRANRDLEETSQELEAQHEELQQTNRELEEQRSALEEEKQKLVSLARELRTSHAEVAEKAREAELANRHKSEFLANVSHELRTPLNSIMILSQVLAENADGDLSEEQTRHAHTINLSGKDLLELINDILDLAKIEAGRTDLHLTELPIAGVVENIERTFAMQMQEKSIAFHVYVDPKLPETIRSDQALVEQILKNLVSNALKFTERGSIAVRFEASDIGAQFCMSVTDTGIGIPVDQQQLIFEAFRQVDNSLSRRFGGTGLGLTISRNLARALGGSIDVDSAPGEGSTFTARLPLRHEAPTLPEETPQLLRARLTEREARFALHDDRDRITERDKTILVIEDDEKFAETVLEKCRRSGFSVLYAADGREGIELAKSFVPHAVILDLRLPEVGGIDVLGSLKGDSNTHHIPVHVMSVENRGEEVLKLGAAAFFEKPVSLENLDATIATIERMTARQAKNVLLVEDESADRSDIRELLDDGTIKVTTAHTVDQARTCLRSHHYDCIILNPTLNGECGVDVLKSFDGEAKNLPPVIVYAGRELTKPELSELEEYPDTIVIKGRDSNRRLLDELTLFLHSVDARRLSLPSPLPGVADNDSLAGKKVLIVDDDMRNVYSLRHVLLSRGLRTVEAHTGREALAALEAEPDVDIVLMDIMMPEMDGIEAIKAIRKISGFAKLPIIALTAKAMKRDREECLQAGADDYLSKPVDIAKLMSAMRVWLSE